MLHVEIIEWGSEVRAKEKGELTLCEIQCLCRGYIIHFISYLLLFTLEDFFNVSLSLYLLNLSEVSQRIFWLLTYLFTKMNASMSPTVHSSPSPLPPYSSNKPLYWFSCFHPWQFQCILYPQQKEGTHQSVCLSPASAFPKVLLNAPQDSA